MPSVAPMTAGFKQVPAGGYLTVISTINPTNVYSGFAKTGSGGSFTVGPASNYVWNNTSNFSTLLRAGKVIKDMGSVQVSSTRVFRRFKAVDVNGVTLGDFTGTDPNFGSFYLETAADGGDVPAANASILARSF